jgi:hypothetical protein
MAGGKKGRDADGDYLTGVSEKIMAKVNPHIMKDHLAGQKFDGGISRSMKPKKPRSLKSPKVK